MASSDCVAMSERGEPSLRRIVVVAGLATLIQILNAAVIQLPAIGASFDVDNGRLPYFVSANSLAFACSLLVCGRLADMYGSRRMVLTGCALYTVASLAICVQPTFALVVGARAVQGVAQAIMVPSSFALLIRLLPAGKRRTRVVGFYSVGGPTGSFIGMIGAALAVRFSTWRVIWLACAIAGAISFGVAWVVATVDSRADGVCIDWLGMALTVAGSTLVTFALAQSELAEHQWATHYVTICLVLGLVALVAFVRWERQLERQGLAPLMAPSLWHRPLFTPCMIVQAMTYGAFMVHQISATLVYQQIDHLNALQTVNRFLPQIATGVIASLFAGYVAASRHGHLLVIAGGLCGVISPVLLALDNGAHGYWRLQFASFALAPVAVEVVWLAASCHLAAVVDNADQATTAGLFTQSAFFGTSTALALATLVQTVVGRREAIKLGLDYDHGSVSSSPAVLRAACQASFWLSTGIAVTAVLVSVLCLRKIGQVKPSPVTERTSLIGS